MSYTLISKQILNSNVNTLNFTSIPQTYKDLIILASARSSGVALAIGIEITFNNISSGYSERLTYALGSSAGSTSRSTSFIGWSIDAAGDNTLSGLYGSSEVYISNYSSNLNKNISSNLIDENNGNSFNAYLNEAMWSNSSAITSIQLKDGSGMSILSGSSFYLYGIK